MLSPCLWSLSKVPSSAVRALANCCLCLWERQLWGAGGPANLFQPSLRQRELAGSPAGEGVPQGSAQTTYHLKAT